MGERLEKMDLDPVLVPRAKQPPAAPTAGGNKKKAAEVEHGNHSGPHLEGAGGNFPRYGGQNDQHAERGGGGTEAYGIGGYHKGGNGGSEVCGL